MKESAVLKSSGIEFTLNLLKPTDYFTYRQV